MISLFLLSLDPFTVLVFLACSLLPPSSQCPLSSKKSPLVSVPEPAPPQPSQYHFFAIPFFSHGYQERL